MSSTWRLIVLALCVLACDLRMGEGVQSLVRRVPIVETVVMQKRATHQLALMRLEVQSGGNAQAHHRDGERVRVSGSRAVLHEPLFGLHPLRNKDVAAVFLYDGHVFRRCLFHILILLYPDLRESQHREKEKNDLLYGVSEKD